MKCFLDAVNKKVAVYKGVGHCVGHAATAKTLKYILETHKIENEEFYYGSTMDFADEEGFFAMMMLRRLLKNVLKVVGVKLLLRS